MKTRFLNTLWAAILVSVCSTAQSDDQSTLSGEVERVWEDGFQLRVGDRSVKVDTWDVFGDNTRGKVSVGQAVSVSGEMSDGEFDATAVNPL